MTLQTVMIGLHCRLNDYRRQAAAAHHKELGFLITGAYSPSKSSTEITTDGVNFDQFTPLPIKLYGHCLLALDSDYGDFFTAGGVSDGNRIKRAFIHKDSQWTEVAEMPTARNGKKIQFRDAWQHK